MAIDFDVGTHRRCTLYTRHEYHGNALSNEARAGRQLFTSAGLRELTRDTRQLARLVEFMRNARSGAYASSAAPEQTARALQNAVERGDVIAVVPTPRTSRGGGAPIERKIRPYYATVTPSQLFRRALPVVSAGRSFQRPVLPRLAADDDLAMWFARPGDVLPDGPRVSVCAVWLRHRRRRGVIHLCVRDPAQGWEGCRRAVCVERRADAGEPV
ncbi:hypothetical protein OKW30_002787 [Paraburkholderia sp. Clong3]|uniref:hypothetical protein n=1 Tax=Paraburkholderia sp. Clong3 TaxID=2991061 RepID=UPI003D192C32